MRFLYHLGVHKTGTAARKARYRASRVLARPANPNLPIELPEQYRAQIDQTMRGDLSETLIRGLSPTGC